MPITVVVNEDWTHNQMSHLKQNGCAVKQIESGTVGKSIAAGLAETDADFIFVVSADTFVLQGMWFPEASFNMLFDPYEWITIWKLGTYDKTLNWESFNGGRIEMASDFKMKVQLARNPYWMNINTQEDLERARKLYDSSK